MDEHTQIYVGRYIVGTPAGGGSDAIGGALVMGETGTLCGEGD